MANKNVVAFVIPAYNEELNISKVIDEINNEFDEVKIIVVNDASKDRTRDIVTEKGVTCISQPFNMGYAMALQTGIKYAKSKGYNRIIQFDADGQHIAKEAKKLIEKMDETDADIVIGSRFLEKGAYKQTFFRKLGTNIFSFLIKVFCKEKISDPTSGFQCLGEKAIDRFSTFGMYPEFPDANLIIELLYSGFKIEEIPVNMRLREFGESMHGGILKPIKYMISVLYTISIIILRNIFRRRGAK